MLFSYAILPIRLLFSKDKELYVFFHRITGYYPRDIKLYRLAMIHRSKPLKLKSGRWCNNERLEFLGDAVLSNVVADFLYRTYPNKREGFLTSTRAKIVQRESLNRIGKSLDLDHRMRAMSHASTHNSYLCGNTLEAIVGAVYLDQGYKRCRRFIINRLIKKYFNLNDLVKTEQNFKSRLIEWAQKYHIPIEYVLIGTHTDDNNNPIFSTAIYLGGYYASEADGYSKKESHQLASRKALDRLVQDHDFSEQVLATAPPPDDTGNSI